MKIEIDLTQEQLGLLINALEVNFRMMMPNQGDIVADLLCELPNKKGIPKEEWNKLFSVYIAVRDNAAHILNALSKVLYGENCDMSRNECHRISDMWSAFRHLQYLSQPQDDGYDVRASKPFQMSDYKMIDVKLLEDNEEEEESK